MDGKKMPGKFTGRQPQSLVEVYGQHRVLIEHHCGVLCYSPEEVTVRVRYGQLRIWGSKLCFARMTGEQLVIRGSIGGLELTGGNGNG